MKSGSRNGRRTIYDLEESVFAMPQIGEPVSSDLVKVVSNLTYFAATVCDKPPEQLRVGDLVSVLRRGRMGGDHGKA